MKGVKFVALILFALCTKGFTQVVFDSPDFIIHLAPEDSTIDFGVQRAFGHFNNDSYEDLVVLAPYYRNTTGDVVGKAYIYYGTTNGIDTTSFIEFEGIHTLSTDASVFFAVSTGDFNNDGFDDLVIGTPRYEGTNLTTRGYAIVLLSKSNGTGIDTNTYVEFMGYTSVGKFAFSITTGDVNNDDVDDLIIAAPQDGNNFEGQIYIYFGGNEFDNTFDKVLKSTGGRQHLTCLSTGDINGDGFDDVVGWDYRNWSPSNRQLHIWLGGENMNQTPSYTRSASYKHVSQVKDLNNDSLADIVVSDAYWENPPTLSPNLTVIKGSNSFDINDDLEIELSTVVRMIRQEFEVEMVILFGSYARDEWVEELGEDEFYYKYQSDFDILVIADRKYANKHKKWDRLEDRIIRSSVVPTPVTLIHHSIGFLNDRLSKGHYFFTDIVKEGILLYDSERHELAEPRELSPDEYKNKAEEYFEQWFESANDFLRQYQYAINDEKYKIAAFLLHQAVERYYSAFLLTLTDYRPKTHDIKRLGKLAAAQEPVLLEVFPKGTEIERQRFKLLRKAYVDARYDKSFSITREELEWLAERVSKLQELTEKICKKKIASFTS